MFTSSKVFSLAATSFLLGITAHSLSPYAHIPVPWIAVGVFISLFTLSIQTDFVRGITCRRSYENHGKNPHKKATFQSKSNFFRNLPILPLFFILGLYRFSLAQPSLPSGLIFANPKGLAMAEPPTHTANRLHPYYWLTRAYTKLTRRAKTRLPPDEAALLTGILYGERGLSTSAKKGFRHAGMLHMVAVSGSNMTLVVVIVMRLFLALRLARRHAFVATVVAIILFTCFVGLSAAVVRAAAMGILVEFAPLVGRLIRPSRLLLVAALGFTVWHPWALFFDASFALSFLAMIGLLTWGRWINERISSHVSSSTVREIITSTSAATIMTTPYAAWAFGSLTLWGLITNLVALPVVPWAMGFGVLALVAPVSSLLFLPAQGCLEFILWISRIPDRVGYGYLDKTFLPFPWFVAIYTILFFLWQMISVPHVPLSSLYGVIRRHEDPFHAPDGSSISTSLRQG